MSMTGKTSSPRLVALFTDFGNDGPYLGQVEAILAASDIRLPYVNLLSNAPAFNPRASAYLLAALAEQMPSGTIFLAVVDPGVGGKRLPLVVQTRQHWFIGPDNGLFSQVIRRSNGNCRILIIEKDPIGNSDTFHGRDLFAPIALEICADIPVAGEILESDSLVGADWIEELREVIYIDFYGNAFTGIRASSMSGDDLLECKGTVMHKARTFCEAPAGQPFWYKNSCGLVELACNQGSIAEHLGLELGDQVSIHR